LRLFQPPHIPTHIAERESKNLTGIFHVNPIVSGTKTALTEHARGDHYTLAFATRARNQASLFEFRQVATDGLARVPRVLKFRDVSARDRFPLSQCLLVEGCSSHKARFGLRFHAINASAFSTAGTALNICTALNDRKKFFPLHS